MLYLVTPNFGCDHGECRPCSVLQYKVLFVGNYSNPRLAFPYKLQSILGFK